MRAQFREPSSGDAAEAALLQRDLIRIQQGSAQLQNRTRTALWRSGRWLPGLSGAVRDTDATADTVHGLVTDVLPAFLTLAGDTRTLRAADGSINVRVLQAQAAPVTAATNKLGALTSALAARHNTGVGSLDQGRARLVAAMTQLHGYAQSAAIALHVAPTVLGADGPRTILVVLESPAEARAGGGLVGGFILLRADAGHISIVASGTNHDLAATPRPVISLGAQYDALYTQVSGRQNWLESNLSPDFPKTGTLWAALFHAQYGITPDAELAVTPAVLDQLLTVTGPVTLTNGVRVLAGRVDPFLQIGLYAKFPTAADETARNAYQLAFLRGTISALLASNADPAKLLTVLGPQINAGSLRLHVTDDATQQLVAATPLGGALLPEAGPFVGAFVDSTDATKLDAYLTKTIAYHRSAPVAGSQQVTVTVTLTNAAPTSGLPAYVDTRVDIPPGPDTSNGSHRFLLAVYLATGAESPSVLLDGQSTKPVLVSREENHLLVWIEPPALAGGGGRETVTVTATEPASDAAPAQLLQPSLNTPVH